MRSKLVELAHEGHIGIWAMKKRDVFLVARNGQGSETVC